MTITNNTGSTGSNINVMIELDTTGLISSGKMDSDCSDVMVYQGDGAIKHWVADSAAIPQKLISGSLFLVSG